MSADLAGEVHRLVLDAPPAELRAAAEHHASRLAPLLPAADRQAVVADVLARVHGFGPLDEHLADSEVTDVLVNAGTEVWVERRGQLRPAGRLAPGVIDQLVERAIGPLGLRLDRLSPLVDARLPDGSRLHAAVAPVAVDGTTVAIRRFVVRTFDLDHLAGPAVGGLLRDLVHRRCNLLVSGATSAGKTTLLNALAGAVPAGERIVTIEDAAELRLATPHVVRLETRPASPDGTAAVTLRDLVRAALRLRPDRLVIGEVRGAEALDMLQALSTGHDGSLATCHANGPGDALRRVEAMVLQGGPGLPLPAVRQLLHGAVDVVVHLQRGRAGRREVAAVVELPREPDGELRPLASAGQLLAPPSRHRDAP